MDKYTLLKRIFGHSAFRPGQEMLIDSLLLGRDVLGVMPTGAGKSVCYQIPAMLLQGITLVISPLISLMKDQVMNLCQNGVPAAYLNSSLSYAQYCEALRRAKLGAYQIIYVAPERLTTPGFLDFACHADIALVAVDEAHCVSQWGQDFRPSYLHIPDFIRQLPKRPVLAAYTATATKEVKEDIVRLLELQEPVELTTGFDRENLFFSVEYPKDKLAWVLRFLREREGRSGIVYCATRAAVEKVCAALQERGYAATRYHAGLEDDERKRNQEAFSMDEKPIMVATNAFGMGIDKSNVSFVIHYNMPKNPESYYQEAGRAGRDGSDAECVLLFSQGDIHTARFFIENAAENESMTEEEIRQRQKRDLLRLNEMAAYCRTTYCLRAHLLRYFGESCADNCGNCGNCRVSYQEVDVTDRVEKLLKSMEYIEDRTRTAFSAGTYTEIFHGTASKAVTAWRLDQTEAFGCLKPMTEREIRELLEQLKLQGILAEELQNGYRCLVMGPGAAEVLRHGGQVRLRQRLQTAPKVRPAARKADEGLLTVLRRLRSRLAAESHIPAYMVFSNATIEDMAIKAPTTLSEFMTVSGIGAVKAKRYGNDFLEAIRAWKG